jgi:hypothetical protein
MEQMEEQKNNGEEIQEEEEEEFMRCCKMFTHSFPCRVLSTNVYTDPAAERETTPTCGYATVCLCLSCTHSHEYYVIPCQMWPKSVK